MRQNVKMNVLLLLQQMECLQYFNESEFINLYNEFKKKFQNSVQIEYAIFDNIIQTAAPLPVID